MSVHNLTPNNKVVQLLTLLIKNNASSIVFPEYKRYSEQDFYSLPIPLNDIEKHKGSQGFMPLKSNVNSVLISLCVRELNATTCTNAIVYGPQSIMDWHTNSNNIGYRTYYTFTNRKAVFRYVDPSTKCIVNNYDNIGWTVRRFKIDKKNLLWHSIWTEGIRFSFGFNSNDITS
jgi:hypothetical protein